MDKLVFFLALAKAKLPNRGTKPSILPIYHSTPNIDNSSGLMIFISNTSSTFEPTKKMK